MRQKLRYAAVVTAILAALAGTALAIAQHTDILAIFFEGAPPAAEEFVNQPGTSISDGRYTLTLNSTVGDGQHTMMLITVEALTDEAADILFSDDFSHMDTFHLHPTPHDSSGGLWWGEGTDTPAGKTRTFSLDFGLGYDTMSALELRLDVMADNQRLSIPLGTNIGSFTLTPEIEVTTPAAYTYRIEQISVSPMSAQVDMGVFGSGNPDRPSLFFRKTDGTLLTQSQLLEFNESDLLAEDRSRRYRTYHIDYSFRQVQDLSTLAAVIVEDTEFPLDGGPPVKVEIPAKLYPFHLPVMDNPGGDGYTVPVRALCDGLGVSCIWNASHQTATVRYRDVTVALTLGSNTALVDGVPQTLDFPVAIQDGTLTTAYDTFDAWGIKIQWWPEDGDWTVTP